MTGDNERPHADKHNGCRDKNATFVRSQHTSTVGSFVYQAFGYKDAVIVALTENKGSQNDVDQIKPHIQ